MKKSGTFSCVWTHPPLGKSARNLFPITCAYDRQGENERRTNDFRYRYHELFKRAEEQLQGVNKLQTVVPDQVIDTAIDSHRVCEINLKKMYQQDVSFDFASPPALVTERVTLSSHPEDFEYSRSSIRDIRKWIPSISEVLDDHEN